MWTLIVGHATHRLLVVVVVLVLKVRVLALV